MIIDLTYKCSMGCSHCMSDCKPDGAKMTIPTLKDTIEFFKRNDCHTVLVSGGEIFEHSNIIECLTTLFEGFRDYNDYLMIILITNGRQLADNHDYLRFLEQYMKYDKFYRRRIIIQVTDDPRFYPNPLTQTQRYRLEKLGAIIDTVPSNSDDKDRCLYPQGRALMNFSDKNWNTKAPKCVNLRLLANQGFKSLKGILQYLSMSCKFCTPSISPYGDIKLGESALCPAVASIYDSAEEIIEKIKNCNCQSCKIPLNILKSSNPIAYDLIIKP